MANAVKALTTGALVISSPVPPLSNAYNGSLTKAISGLGRASVRLQALVLESKQYVFGSEDFIIGSPSPSLRMDASGMWRFRWAMEPGPHSVSVNVNHAVNQNPRPSIKLKANPAIGVPIDVEVFAPPGPGWVTVGVPTFTTTARGATWVELHNNLETHVGFSPCYWDSIKKV